MNQHTKCINIWQEANLRSSDLILC